MSVPPSAEASGPDGIFTRSSTVTPTLTPTVTPPGMATAAPKTMMTRNYDAPIILIPQPSDDANDPLNWSITKKIIIFACICFAGFAGQMSPNSNQLTFVLQIPNYVGRTQADMLNTVAAALAGWMLGPFILVPWAALVGRSSVIFWSLIGTLACQIWAAKMTGPNDFIPFAISRAFCGVFGVIPATLGTGYIMDMFFLHQRGKAFAIFEVLIIFAVVGGGTLGGFIAEYGPWSEVFWWTVGPVGAAAIAVFVFVEDTTFTRGPNAVQRPPLPKAWLANRVATFFPGIKTQAGTLDKRAAVFRRFIVPLQITITPITLLIGTFVFVALGLPIMQASTIAIYLMPPVSAGGYGFSALQLAFFTMTAWAGIISAQLYGYLSNDRIPLTVARRVSGIWRPEYRLANTLLPGFLLPIGLAIYGAGLQLHLHYMVLALASFVIWFAALLALPVCYNYIVECFVQTPVEASVALNSYRIAFGLMSVFIITQWQGAVGVGWMWGMGSLFVLLVDGLMVIVLLKGHEVRKYTSRISSTIAVTEDGQKIIEQPRIIYMADVERELRSVRMRSC
ncbi:hypothetical protein VC83_01430 [Pseudogymnoascus destructans]|uniref:Major facilitator superfamily (MFS) profile domain-containing protein n=2 Tax=Pseudogymnoascus destructans TaxID=655981 RepID=L8FTG4_PSED2|nr:uncharacterized protein VC83_01430 [Pseudogymnoascus destructans]ELR03006.1 hypothetical protein GMDG_05861 [Pseudogymnoascus destructans 20631-21]OAF62106.2 hypothetical protein VC83_01430 [Pseudogymnoascus destructans]